MGRRKRLTKSVSLFVDTIILYRALDICADGRTVSVRFGMMSTVRLWDVRKAAHKSASLSVDTKDSVVERKNQWAMDGRLFLARWITLYGCGDVRSGSQIGQPLRGHDRLGA